VLDNPYLNLIKNKELATITSIDEYTSLNVDGGTINNDPFEITLKILNDRINASTGMEESKPEDFESVVLMIDPFPNDSEAPEINYKPMKAFRFIIPKILNAMLGELRMKENMYESAYDINNPSMFLIVPSRSEAKNENYIACGSLGGFGGFFSKEFRKHDFLLGRRNCQYFLRKYFSVARDAGNPILEYGYEDVNDMAKYAVDLGGKEFIPLIPDMRVIFDESTGSYSVKTQAEIAEDKYPFPNIKLKDILDLKKPLRSRFSVILDNISNGKAPETEKKESEILKKMRKKAWYEKALSTVFYKPLGWVGLKMAKNKARKMLADMFIEMVIQDMEDNELLNVNNKKPRLKI